MEKIQGTVEVQGRVRSFIIVGEQTASEGRPLVLVFHGSTQTGRAHRRFTDRQYEVFAESGAVVVYLDGYRRHWNDIRLMNSSAARREDVDDIAFVDAVIDRLVLSHGVSRSAVYGIGFSNGGQLVYRLLLSPEPRLAGAVVVAATLPAPENLVPSVSPTHARPTPLLLVHGSADPISPSDGGSFSWWARRLFRAGGRMRSLTDTATFFAELNGIDITSASRSTHDAAIERVDYVGPDAPPVVAVTVRGGGHSVPAGGRSGSSLSVAELAGALLGLPHR